MFSSNTSAVSGDANYIEDVFSTWLYTGNGSAQTITNSIDLSTKGGMVWTKCRSGAFNNTVHDTVRGVNNYLVTDTTGAQANPASNTLTAFTTTGYSIGAGSLMNSSTQTYSGWTFREQEKFFDVVTYTGTGSSRTVAHSLGSTPGCIIVKRTSGVENWTVYHRSQGANKVGFLNLTNAFGTNNTIWGNTSPTSTVFTVGDADAGTNANGSTYVAYVFAHDAGGFGLTGTDNVISCGSFTASGSGTASINLGYEPQWLLYKPTTGSSDWIMFDTMRGFSNAATDARLWPNLSSAEDNAYNYGAPTATGMDLVNVNANEPYIYIAIRRGPMKVPTDATKVFQPSVRASGTGAAVSTTGLGFPPDLLVSSERTSGVLFAKGWHDRLRGNVILLSNSTNNEAADSTGVTAYGQDGFSFGTDGGFATVNYSGSNYVYEAFRRAPSFFDEVCYTGTGTAGQTFSHNLGVAPELMIVKCRSTTGEWRSYSSALTATKWIVLNTTAAAVTGAAGWNNTEPTASVFSVGNSSTVNGSGTTYVAYLFATCPGVSKVGSYTGTGTTLQINCGFAAGARFVLIKKTSGTGSWYVWDTARGIVSGNDPYLLLNSTAAEVTSTDYIDAYSAGFEISSTAPSEINENGGSFIFLAIA